MPKISSAQGPTIDGVAPSEIEGAHPVPPQEFDQHRFFKEAPPVDESGGDDVSPGTNSSASEPTSEPTPAEPAKKSATPRPARPAASRSK